MRVKVSIEVERDRFMAYHMETCKMRLYNIRFDAIYRRRSFFGNDREIPREHEVLFAKIYHETGAATIPIKKFLAWKEKYLKDVKEVWNEYYNAVAHGEIPMKFGDKCQSEILDRLISAYGIGICSRLIRYFKGNVQSFDPELTVFFDIVEGGNKYELAAYLSDFMNVSLCLKKYYPPIIQKLGRVKMKKGIKKMSISSVMKGYEK